MLAWTTIIFAWVLVRGIYTPNVAHSAGHHINTTRTCTNIPHSKTPLFGLPKWIRTTGPNPPAGTVMFDYFNSLRFGSAHSGGFNMAFCDGSVHNISYEIDPTVHAMLCDRGGWQSHGCVDVSRQLGERPAGRNQCGARASLPRFRSGGSCGRASSARCPAVPAVWLLFQPVEISVARMCCRSMSASELG